MQLVLVVSERYENFISYGYSFVTVSVLKELNLRMVSYVQKLKLKKDCGKGKHGMCKFLFILDKSVK